MGSSNDNRSQLVIEPYLDVTLRWPEPITCPPDVVSNGLTVSFCFIVLADLAGEREFNCIENRALPSAVSAVDDSKSVTECKTDRLSITSKSARLHVADLHVASSITLRRTA